MAWITKEGRTVEEAQRAAVADSGLLEEELEIEVLNEGAKGLFGLGGEPAVVRVRPKSEAVDFRSAFQDDITPAGTSGGASTAAPPAKGPVADESAEAEPEEPEDEASKAERQQAATDLGVEIIQGIMDRMSLSGEIRTRVDGGTVYIEVFGDEMGILIGRSGTTLEALQEIVRAGIQRRLKTRQAVVVDIESYWERRRKPQKGSGGGSRGGSRGGRGSSERGGSEGSEGGGQRRSRGRRGGRRGRRSGQGAGQGSGQGGRPQGEVDGNRRDPEPEEVDGNR